MSNGYNNHPPPPSLPLHLCFFLLILLTFVGITWYIKYDSIFDGLFDQLKLLLMLSPLLLLLALHLLHQSFFFLPLPDQDSFHKAGGTPWGVALMLVLLFFMISYQSDLRESWFPLLS